MREKCAVIGAGVTGLTAAYELQKRRQQVVVFESSDQVGGIAGGFKQTDWDWFLDYHYHHVFTGDKDIKHWLAELDLADELLVLEPKSVNYYQGKIAQLDSALALLRYPFLSWSSKLRTAAVMGFCKFWPWGQVLERWTAQDFICLLMGQESWEKIWQPLFLGKFGELASEVNAAWFWARIYARSQKLVYVQGGFQHLFNQVQAKLQDYGVEFRMGVEVEILQQKSGKLVIAGEEFDQVLFTGHSSTLLDLFANWSADFQEKLKNYETLAAMTLVLELEDKFLPDDIYWLNINESDWPFSGVIEHTNFVSAEHYNGRTLVYLANYLPADSQELTYDKNQVLSWYDPYLEKLNANYKNDLKNSWLYKTKNAQPFVRCHHSQILPKIKTPAPNLFWAGMQHVYPYDRGTNYAVRLGRQAAQIILQTR